MFEPLYYFGCHWNGATCGNGVVPQLWRIYSQWDPLFLRKDIPSLLWLRVMCTLEVILFGPCYVLCAIGLAPAQPEGVHAPWLPQLALPFCGALVYSTLVYFGVELLDAPSTGANLAMVFLINAPWTVVPCLLLAKCLPAALRDNNSKLA